ncbi:MAG: hypothetical protein ACHQF0_16990 [Chitinophagales bacterium]
MSIIISQDGKNAQKIDKSDFEREGHLQNYVHENPESIPVYEIEEDKRLFVVSREFPTESGPIDALAIDKDGDIYVVETKLYKNPEKRTVVAQALDYGASLWRHSGYDKFITIANNEINKKFSISFEEKIKDLFDIDDEEIVSILDAIKNNLQQGIIKFVILMDSIHDRLKDLIVYINQNSQFDIYAVQMEYYKFEKYEIVIPKLFGVEVKKNVGRRTSDWTGERFLDDARNKIKDNEAYKTLCELYDFIEKHADVADFGKGSEGGSITFKVRDSRAKSGLMSIFTLRTFGFIWFRFGYIRGRIGQEYVKLYFDKLKSIFPTHLWKEEILTANRPGFSLNELFKDEKKIKQFETTPLS